MRRVTIAAAAAVLWVAVPGQGGRAMVGDNRPEVSFEKEIYPIIKKHCLPCHAEDNFNPSGLALDTYESLLAGGENGKPVEPGNGAESILVKKLGPNPPFGKMMPVDKKKKAAGQAPKRLSEEEIRLIVEWIDQGAKNN